MLTVDWPIYAAPELLVQHLLQKESSWEVVSYCEPPMTSPGGRDCDRLFFLRFAHARYRESPSRTLEDHRRAHRMSYSVTD